MNALDLKINAILQCNSLILFDQQGRPVKFEYQRHICSKIGEIPGKTKEERIKNSIVLAINLWNFWEIHIRNSTYPFKWFGCIQVEDIWVRTGCQTPPYVIFNSTHPEKIAGFNEFIEVDSCEFPINLRKYKLPILRKMAIKRALFKDDNSLVWRIFQKELK